MYKNYISLYIPTTSLISLNLDDTRGSFIHSNLLPPLLAFLSFLLNKSFLSRPHSGRNSLLFSEAATSKAAYDMDHMNHNPTTTVPNQSTTTGADMMNMDMDMDTNMNTNMNMAMAMAFHTGITDLLYSESWKPTTTGQYVGTCIFLILLAVVHRFLATFKGIQEAKWHEMERKRVIVVAGALPGAGNSVNTPLGNNSKVTVEQHNELDTGDEDAVRDKLRSPWLVPWRFSTELPRAGLGTVVSGVGYLLYVHPFIYPYDCSSGSGEERILTLL